MQKLLNLTWGDSGRWSDKGCYAYKEPSSHAGKIYFSYGGDEKANFKAVKGVGKYRPQDSRLKRCDPIEGNDNNNNIIYIIIIYIYSSDVMISGPQSHLFSPPNPCELTFQLFESKI